MNVGLNQLLVASAALFAVGAFALVARRSAIVMLLGTQFMFAAGAIAFVAFGTFGLGARTFGAGAAVALFAGATAVAELAVGLTMAALIYREHRSFAVDADRE
ncbi:MAG: NADH-quinone oxidoreductase subunit NuoK [Chloroflexi bacterium]|nr:MAG: NADH-quinone oxidoreductase subunit NuoK [Chloroflexota bacterium]TMG49581.1 MAG: NADH-quinone oxidoreductase subunit NuoK [Chloroflexota bacterium]